MNIANSQWQSIVRGILPHPEAPMVLILPDHDGATWALPHVVFPWRMGFSAVRPVTQAMTELLGIPVTALRCAAQQVQDNEHTYQGVFTLENHNPLHEPPLHGSWVDRHRLAKLALSPETDRTVIVRYLEEAEGIITPQNRRAWHRPGWYAAAHAWIESTLRAKGYTVTGPINQYDSWGLTCLMQVETAQGNVFFKTAPDLPLFAHEPTVMAGLAALFPNRVPMPIAVEPAQRWMLLADFGASYYDRPSEEADAAKPSAMRAFADLQIEAVPHLEQLLEMGCLDRRLVHLMDHAETLFTDERIMAHFEPTEVQQLCTRLPYLRDLCTQLGRFAIPETLIHGDLGIGNVAGTAAQPIFFDWTEAAVSHPFFDIFDMFFAENPAQQTGVRDSYLAAWTAYESPERLREAWAIARPLCALYHAVSYRNVYTNLESPFQEAMLPFVHQWSRRVLAYTNG